MNENENLVPKRRFKEFTNTGTWEQRKLGEFADISTGKLDANAMVEDGEYDFYTSGMKKYRIDTPAFEGPAITIAGNGATVGYMHLADGEFNAYQRTYVLQNFQANRYFLYSEISKKLPRKIAQEARTGNIPYIVMDMLTELTISLPVLEEEQAKIGAFFKQLDNTIALHQRKLTLLEQLKQTYLQVMFPQGQDSIPILRFAGHSEPWEQYKLGEISKSYSGGTPSVAIQSYYGGSIPFIRSAEINSKNTELYLTEEGLNNSSAKLVDVGDILYALYGATSGEVGISQINGAINQAILAIKPKIEYDSNFIMQWLRRQKMSIISTYLQGGQGNLSGSIVKDLALYAPTKQEEQTKIGSFFKQLDDTIALHQEKIAHLKVLKSTLLNKMFI